MVKQRNSMIESEIMLEESLQPFRKLTNLQHSAGDTPYDRKKRANG